MIVYTMICRMESGDRIKRLYELQANQQIARGSHVDDHWDPAEISAMQKLAFKLWGGKGLLECGPDELGIMYAGFYIDPPVDKKGKLVANHNRRRRLVLRFRTHVEMEKQARMLMAQR